MQTQTVEFMVKSKNGIVQSIEKSTILQPKTNYNGRKTVWFDDSRLLKANHK